MQKIGTINKTREILEKNGNIIVVPISEYMIGTNYSWIRGDGKWTFW